MKILLFFLLVTFSGCGDGVLMSKHVKRLNGPIDGRSKDYRFSHDKARYSEGNLAYLSDYKSRNNSLYFDSIKKINKINYQVAKDYFNEYEKFLRVDADELENIIRHEQDNKTGASVLRKMEAGELQKYPIKENIKVIQRLKDEKNKMAFPNYMTEYLNIEEKQSKDDIGYIAELEDDREEKTKLYTNKNGKITSRDEYIDFYFREMNISRNDNLEKYKEKPL